MQLKLLAVFGVIYLAAALPDEREMQKEWLNFQQRYGNKAYRSLEENQESYTNFKNNYQLIEEHNRRYEQGLETYNMAINPYSNRNLKEMEKLHMGFKMSPKDQEIFDALPEFEPLSIRRKEYPKFKDWRSVGAVGPVKNQGACGSCWAFATTGALESHHFINHNRTRLLSEQNLVDCVAANRGCNGGSALNALKYVRDNDGINTAKSYPYEGADGPCRFDFINGVAKCNGYHKVLKNSEKRLLKAVAEVGPVIVAIDANSNFQNYKSGVFNDPTCSKKSNHLVLVVGYGSEGDLDYWLVKNSWGREWGDKGYIKMARNKNNQCGIAQYALYPLV